LLEKGLEILLEFPLLNGLEFVLLLS